VRRSQLLCIQVEPPVARSFDVCHAVLYAIVTPNHVKCRHESILLTVGRIDTSQLMCQSALIQALLGLREPFLSQLDTITHAHFLYMVAGQLYTLLDTTHMDSLVLGTLNQHQGRLSNKCTSLLMLSAILQPKACRAQRSRVQIREGGMV
jgi:hypothetical protein